MDTAGDKPVEEIKGKLEKIYHESLRTAKIVQSLLTFARSKKAERQYLSLNEIVRQTCELRGYSLKANNVEVVIKLAKDLPRTMLDPYQMQQVFINIMNNAEDAMVEQNGGGRLEIATSVSRGRLIVTFSDDGPGVDKEILRNVFDPFFTTKEVGKGTGLGLSITHGIVTEHDGTINIKSPEHGGSVVTVAIPVLEDRQWVETKIASENVGEVADLTGTEVLIVDDEESIREALSDILEHDGFKVETARDGHEAMNALDRKRFSLLITDIRMPGVGGMDFYHSILKKHPYLKDKVIVVTGDIFSKEIKNFLAESGCPYFLKPFEPKKLSTLVHRVLSA
jgi:two-component system NtrC family sensor kinase